MTASVTLQSPLDMHLHFREGEMAKTVVPLSELHFAGGVVMPNLVPPVDCKERLESYTQEISTLTTHFEAYHTLFFRAYSKDELLAVKDKIIGIKLYPAGITTNSEAGVASLREFRETFELMQELGIPLLVHGESDSFVMDRERDFLTEYQWLAENFPQLTIIMEHITTAAAVDMLDKFSNLFATVTAHHLLITLDEVAGGLLQPHLFCKPIPKRPEDKSALVRAVTKDNSKIMFGSDSAPHPQSKKECCGCAAGVFTAPIALPLLAEVFDSANALDQLQAFVSDNAQRIYGITPPEKTITLINEPCVVPDSYQNVIPMRAGESLPWSVAKK